MQQLDAIKRDGISNGQIVDYLSTIEPENCQLADVEPASHLRLHWLNEAFFYIAKRSNVPKPLLASALLDSELVEYNKSIEIEVVPNEDELNGEIPSELKHYADLLRKADKLDSLANAQRKRNSIKTDSNGKTAVQRLRSKAEVCYEAANEYLFSLLVPPPERAMGFDAELASSVRRWLDRDVDTRIGFEPSTDCVGVARIKGSKSVHCLTIKEPLTSKKYGRYWRQRTALVESAASLIFLKEVHSDAVPTKKNSKLDRLINLE